MKKRSSWSQRYPVQLLSATLPLLSLPAFGASYPEAVKQDKPLGYYRFNDSAERPQINANSGSLGAAGTATNVNVRSIMGGAVVGGNNAAAYFDSTARTIIPWNANLNPDASKSFTIEAWFMATSDKVAGRFVGPAPIMNRYSGAVANRQGWVYFQRNPDDRAYDNGQTDIGWNFRMYSGSGGSVGVQVTSRKPYKLGVWQHVVTVWDVSNPDSRELIMYIDGEEAARATVTDPEAIVYTANTDDHGEESVNGAAGLAIGSYNNTEAGANAFRGGVDEVALYAKALTPEQIKAHYDNALNPDRTTAYDSLIQSEGPVGYWRLDDPSAGADIAVNMGLLQSEAPGINTAEVVHPVAGALAGSSDTAYTYHWRNGTSTTSLPHNPAMNPPASQPFTIEAWFRPTSDRQNPGACPLNNRYAKNNRTGWVFFQRSPNATYNGVAGNEGVGWNFRMYTGTTGTGQDVTSGPDHPYTIGQWQHVVATWSGGEVLEGTETVIGTSSLYIDGVLAATNPNCKYTANSSTPEDGDPANAADFAIGSYNRSSTLGSNPFEGDIDEVAFYGALLTPEQITAHYEAGIDRLGSQQYANLVLTAPFEAAIAAYEADPNLPKPTDALQPVTYLRLDDKAAAPVANSGTAGDQADGAVVVVGTAGSGPQAPGFPGFESDNASLAVTAKSWVNLNNPTVLNRSGNLTLEAWVKSDATQGAVARIISHGPPTLSEYPAEPVREGAILAGSEVSLRIDTRAEDGVVEYVFGTSDGTDTHGVTAPVPAEDLGSDQWVHLVGTYNGTAWTLYRNGVVAGTVTDPVGPLAVDNAGWAIGSTGNGWDQAYAGLVDEVAIYGEALTVTQVAAHYGAATSSGSNLSIARSGNQVTLTWSGGILQESSVVTGGFADSPGAVSPLTIAAPSTTKFYRLR